MYSSETMLSHMLLLKFRCVQILLLITLADLKLQLRKQLETYTVQVSNVFRETPKTIKQKQTKEKNLFHFSCVFQAAVNAGRCYCQLFPCSSPCSPSQAHWGIYLSQTMKVMVSFKTDHFSHPVLCAPEKKTQEKWGAEWE